MSLNPHCKCPAAGWCERHSVHKSAREHQLCQGVNCTPAQMAKYWNAWEAGLMAGQPAPVADPKPLDRHNKPHPAHRSRGLGDRISHAITAFTGITPCGGCKGRAAWLNHWFPETLPPIEPVTLTAPVRHLMCHLWPVKGFGAWQWNCDQLLSNAKLFNGHRVVAIAIDNETDSASTVKDYLKDFTDDFIVVGNNSKLREVLTFVPMLERLEKYQSDQDVTFICHGKAVRHKISADNAGSTLFRWAGAMYETLLTRPASIEKLLETYAAVGSFRRYGTPQHGGWGLWHYSGSFCWFRNRDAFRRNWRYVPQRFYGTEAWPGLMFRPEESACVIGDNVGDSYNVEYWNSQIEPQLAAWRAAQ
jgi:hypothetical protein